MEHKIETFFRHKQAYNFNLHVDKRRNNNQHVVQPIWCAMQFSNRRTAAKGYVFTFFCLKKNIVITFVTRGD